MPQTDKQLYRKVIKITTVYLGPAAERFIDRQIENHLHKQPQSLTAKDLGKLIDWIHIAVSFLSKDATLVDEYINRLRELSRDKKD